MFRLKIRNRKFGPEDRVIWLCPSGSKLRIGYKSGQSVRVRDQMDYMLLSKNDRFCSNQHVEPDQIKDFPCNPNAQ